MKISKAQSYDIEDVYNLTIHQYKNKNYVSSEDDIKYYNFFDWIKETSIFIIKNKKNNIIATVSMTYNNELGFPIDKNFINEFNQLISNYKKVAVVWRLISQNSTTLKLLFTEIKNVFLKEKCEALIIIVNPQQKQRYIKKSLRPTGLCHIHEPHIQDT